MSIFRPLLELWRSLNTTNTSTERSLERSLQPSTGPKGRRPARSRWPSGMSGNETMAAESQGARTDDADTAKAVVPTSLLPSGLAEVHEEITKTLRTVEQRRLQNLEAQRAFRTRRAKVQGEEARLSRQWSWTTWLQNIAALAGLAALLITGFFAVRMYMLAMWTARKDAVGFCSNLEQQVCDLHGGQRCD